MPHFGIVMSTHLLVTCPCALPSLPTYLLLVHLLCDHARLLISFLPILPLSPTYLLLVLPSHPLACYLFAYIAIIAHLFCHHCPLACCMFFHLLVAQLPSLPSLLAHLLLTCLPYLRTIAACMLCHHRLACLLHVSLVHVCFKLQAWYFPLTCLCNSWNIGMHNFHFNKKN